MLASAPGCQAPKIPNPAPVARIQQQSQESQDARKLGAVYEVLRLSYPRALPLGRWALPGIGPKASGSGADLAAALAAVYPYEGDGTRMQHPARVVRYEAAHRRLMPLVRRASVSYALRRLAESRQLLDGLLTELKAPDKPRRLGELARQLRRENHAVWPAMLGRALPEDVKAVERRHPENRYSSWATGPSPAFIKDLEAVTAARTAAARLQVGVAVKAKGDLLLATLFYSRRGPTILDALADDHTRGAARAANDVAESCHAVAEFAAGVTGDVETAWRYPALVLGGVGEMGLLVERQGALLYPGFAAYAIEIGALLGQTAWERLIPLGGGVLFCIGLVVPGAALVAAAGLALDVASTAITVTRAREQELAALAFDQLPPARRPIERPDWGPAALEAAFLLVSAASFFRVVRAGAPRGVARSTSPPPTAARAGPIPPLGEVAPPTVPTEPRRAVPSVPQPVRVRPGAQASPRSARRPADPNDEARGLTDRAIGERGTANRAAGGEPAPTPRDLEEEERIAAFRREQGDTPEQIRTFRERWRQERAAARSRGLARGPDALDDDVEPAAAPSQLAPISGAQEVPMTQAQYRAAQQLVYPSQFADPLSVLVDSIGQRAAQRAVADPRFVAAVNSGNFRDAGTLFHSAARIEVRELPASAVPAGWRISAERTIQSGAGGSRVDVFLVGPAGRIIEYDWKTTGRSGLSTGSRREMARHAAQIGINVPGVLSVQESRSWIDFVRPLMPTAPWPRG